MSDAALIVPAKCRAGHLLEPRTCFIQSGSGSSYSRRDFECLICLRIACWTAHFPDEAVPGPVIEPEMFKRQNHLWEGRLRRAVLFQGIRFESEFQYEDPDSTPAIRAERVAAELNAQHELALAEAAKMERADRAVRETERQEQLRVQRAAGLESTLRIRELMGAR